MRATVGLGIAVTLMATALFLLPTRADEAKVAAPEKEVLKITLAHTDPDAMMLFLFGGKLGGFREAQKSKVNEKSLVPSGIDGMLGYPLDGSVLAQGSPRAIQDLRRVIQLADVKMEMTEGLFHVTVSVSPANANAARETVLHLAGAGFSDASEKGLTLTGSQDWVRAAMRDAIRIETAERK